MKYKNVILVIALSAMCIMSCDEEKKVLPEEDLIEEDPIEEDPIIEDPETNPLSLTEKISRYNFLNAYTNSKLGVGIDLALYMQNEKYRKLVNENFDEITIGYDMKHGAMVNSSGVINFTNVDALLNRLGEAGLTVYGHTLVWHQNQNASYLRGLTGGTVPEEPHYLINAGFEDEIFTDWNPTNPGDGISIVDDVAHEGTHSVKMVAKENTKNDWDLQLMSPAIALLPGIDYTFSFYVKSDFEGEGRISFPGLDGDNNVYPYMNWTGTGVFRTFKTSSAWQLISVNMVNFASKYKAGSSSMQLSFDMGLIPGITYYIDDIKIIEKPSTLNPVLVREALEKWINGMMAHYKGKVKAWDVVNEPMDDGAPSTVKTGKNKTLASDEFYWQDYLGDKDYAVAAFKLARAAADADDILFINDYNLEQSLAKCDGLINYVKEIELLGAEVNGIGTQMHISINTNKDNIAQMFERLGRTGKLIKISELDIKIGTASPTTEQYTQQAEMYQYVIDMYLKYIPEAQRYGISVWGISDNANEHVYWISNDAPNLWDKDYQRKHAYKGFADGLAGKDVSEDFTENLQ